MPSTSNVSGYELALRWKLLLASVLVAALVTGAIGLAVFLTKESQPDVTLSGTLLLRDSYILSTCMLDKGDCFIWEYDFQKSEFSIHARRKDFAQLLLGSTREQITWVEQREGSPFPIAKAFSLRGGAEPRELDMAAITAFPIGTGANFNFLEQAHNNPSTVHVSSAFNLPFSPLQWALVDLESGKEIGKLPTTKSPQQRASYLGKSKEYFIFSDIDATYMGEIVVLDATTLKELLRRPLKQMTFASEIHAVSESEFIVEDGMGTFTECRLIGEGESLEIEVMETVNNPESVWKPSIITGLKNMYSEVVDMGMAAFPPNWDPDEINMPTRYFRNGILAWELVDPPVIRIAKANEPSNWKEIPLSNPGAWDWQFQLSDDASLLVTRSAADSFQIWRVNFPEVKLWQECRLVHDLNTDTLSLVRLQENTD